MASNTLIHLQSTVLHKTVKEDNVIYLTISLVNLTVIFIYISITHQSSQAAIVSYVATVE